VSGSEVHAALGVRDQRRIVSLVEEALRAASLENCGVGEEHRRATAHWAAGPLTEVLQIIHGEQGSGSFTGQWVGGHQR
jgi:hypothetical protein